MDHPDVVDVHSMGVAVALPLIWWYEYVNLRHCGDTTGIMFSRGHGTCRVPIASFNVSIFGCNLWMQSSQIMLIALL
jgi:hypothetical protein